MTKFATAPIAEVAPKRSSRQPSERSQIKQEYQDALKNALENHQALVVELDEDDKSLTIRNRLISAAKALNYAVKGDNALKIRRRGNRISAYMPTDVQSQTETEDETEEDEAGETETEPVAEAQTETENVPAAKGSKGKRGNRNRSAA